MDCACLLNLVTAPVPSVGVMLRKILRRFAQRVWDVTHATNRVGIVLRPSACDEAERVYEFYEKCGMRTVRSPRFSTRVALTCRHFAYDLDSVPMPLLSLARIGRAFDSNSERNPLAPWRWHEVLTASTMRGVDAVDRIAASKHSLRRLRSLQLSRVYLFGTGPSLDRANEFDFHDGYRVVCNTIVKNVELLEKLQPHIITAGDALYHFSETAHAERFREDLFRWLERSSTLFVYPQQYDVCMRALSPPSVQEQLVPVPQGQRTRFVPGLETDFALPNLGNVLNLLLLPIGTYLAQHITLLGFDGRDPNATGFWRNSSANSYPELIEQLDQAYPAFRRQFVPDSDPEKYVREVLGEQLRSRIRELSQEGFVIDLLAPSYLIGLADLPVR